MLSEGPWDVKFAGREIYLSALISKRIELLEAHDIHKRIVGSEVFSRILEASGKRPRQRLGSRELRGMHRVAKGQMRMEGTLDRRRLWHLTSLWNRLMHSQEDLQEKEDSGRQREWGVMGKWGADIKESGWS